MPATTPAKSRRFAFDLPFRLDPFHNSSIGPKRNELSEKLRARPHRENIANDSADTGRRALKRLDRARVIVAFDLERNRPAVPDIDHAGIFFARPNENVRPGCRKFFQLAPRIFVGTMLAPHDRENSQLGKIRCASENFHDAFVLLRREPMFAHYFGRNLRFRSHLLRTLTDVAVATTGGN